MGKAVVWEGGLLIVTLSQTPTSRSVPRELSSKNHKMLDHYSVFVYLHLRIFLPITTCIHSDIVCIW